MLEMSLGEFRAITFAQSLHRTDRELVLAAVHDMLEPGGALVLIHHSLDGFGLDAQQDHKAGPSGIPPIPHQLIGELLRVYLGYEPAPHLPQPDRHEAAIARSAFGGCERLMLPGRPDILRTPESIFEMIMSMSFASPEAFGDRLDEFKADVINRLREASPAELFWEWPGDTEVLIARKPS